MVQERKCILCQMVYCSKKEMDEHMRSMLHHRELENLRGRDCSHECRVCRVTVVGLSTYAKHISSQLHKDKVYAWDKEGSKEEDEEDYFDKELIQLINRRREQNQQDDTCSFSKEQEYRRRDERLTYQGINQHDWKRDMSERSWQWQKESFSKPRQNFLHSTLSLNSNRHLPGPRGRAGWHLSSQTTRQLVHVRVEGSWHSNAGGATSWHQRGRGFHWQPEGNGIFPNQHSRNCVGNWQPNSYNNSQWNFSGNVENFPQGRNWPQRHCDTGLDQDSGWSKKSNTSNNFCKERFKWKKAENVNSSTVCATLDRNSSNKMNDFTRDNHIENNFIDVRTSDSSDAASSKTKPALSSEKNSVTKDKQHRWSPYPLQKTSDQNVPPVADKNVTLCSEETKSGELQADQNENLAKLKVTEDLQPEQSSGNKSDFTELRSSRMPSLKSPLRNIPDTKTFALKRDQKNPFKGVKMSLPPFGERHSRLSALNLETIRSNCTSKFRSAVKSTTNSEEAQENSNKEPVETLGEVLRKAKEMLRNSQALRSSCTQSLSSTFSDPKTGGTEATHGSFQNGVSSDEILEDVSDDDLFSNAPKMETAVESPSNNCDKNVSLKADDGTKSLEQITTNSGPFIAKSFEKCSVNNESPDSGDNRNSPQSQDCNDCENLEIISDLELQKSAGHSSNPILPELSKLGLPVSLQRDLTRHISSRSKPGTHPPEPNLNSARRIRNKSGHRKSDGDKDSGLKPTLRQILNVSRRNINWEQVMQQVSKKRQEQGKGLPRFGIEMVAQVQSEHDGLDFDEESDLGIESYHWESITASPLGSVRKRSLSESSVAVEKGSVYNIFNSHTSDTSGEPSIPTRQLTPATSGPKEDSSRTSPASHEKIGSNFPVEPPAIASSSVSSSRLFEMSQSQRGTEETCAPSDSLCMFQNTCVNVVATVSSHVDGGTDSCASSTEQNDNQGVGKKRRATGDGSCPETSILQRDSKRRKIRGKKERSQVDQLLNISLKEEELNNSLQGVDNNLNQARTALQAAYLEVQRLMILKQQITVEMGTLRTQRIQILQGLQGTFGSATEAEEGGSSIATGPQPSAVSSSNVLPLQLEAPPYLPTQTPDSSLLPAPVPTFTPAAILPAPATTATPYSPVAVKQEPVSPGAEENLSTPPLPWLQAAAPPETNEASNEKQYVSTATSPPPDLSPTPVFSQTQEVDIPENPPTSVPGPLQGRSLPFSMSPKGTDCPVAPSELIDSTLISANSKAGKKKKKLRKKKTLRAAHVPENSDTEQDVSKPVRKVKCRKLSKEATVSTSTPLEMDAMSQDSKINKDDNDSDSSIEMMELPKPCFEVVEIDSNDEKPDSPSKTDLANCPQPGKLEKNDEVTSTSELGTRYPENILTSIEQRAPTPGTKNSSEVSSGEDEEPTEGHFEGHQASVNAIQVYRGVLYTCSADKKVRAYNLVTRKCKAIFEGHTSKVNCLLVTHRRGGNIVLYTGSSDHTVRCFNVKTKECIDTLDLGERVLCLHTRWKNLYAGLANGTVVTFSTKSNAQMDMFECHGPRAVSCMATAQEGARKLLLVGSYDCTISVRDARNGLLLRTLEGHSKTVLCMKVVNDLVFSGSSDQSVHAHNIHTGELVRIYKGHNHAVTVVNILGQVMVTACLDKFVRVYELQSHDRLQVYGGYSDMIMCMSIYKSMIYTGCYDGSVQAVRLNLMKNYRCWWHGCSLIFGVADHLKQHLLNDHTNPNFQTFKCRWKNCDGFFTARRGSKQEAIEHIERHAGDSELNT
ncbi:PREDICTED: zinc finger protein 106 [Nanorana parkeri]|uniref:zinc finger protein 106 n=1 Tax=Nanorana parkeri TaxID=125878 RepID=UPI00085420F8|nr:PREDICTED: zinc finger protein 106 [Nanorana parkeri]